MVKVVRVHEFGGPEVLRLDEVELGAPGPGEVRVRQQAIGLNFIDVYQRKGTYQNPLPFTPGSEGAGEVVAVGSGVTSVRPGDRVAYGTAIGAYATERLLPAEKLFVLPDDISTEVGAVMMLKGMTVQYLLRQTHVVKPGDTLLVHAAAGGVGLILCQWAKALGATVIGTVGSEEKARLSEAHGADHTILYRSEDFAARVKEITNGKLCDVVYDSIGKATFPASLDCLRPRGLFVSFGGSSGQIEAFNINMLAGKGSLYATRPTLGNYAVDQTAIKAMAGEVADVIRSGKVKIDIHARFALADVAEAHKALEGRETSGATILVP